MPAHDQYRWLQVTDAIIENYQRIDRARERSRLPSLPVFVPQDMYEVIRAGLRHDYQHDHYLELQCRDDRHCYIYPLTPHSLPHLTIMQGGTRPQASTF